MKWHCNRHQHWTMTCPLVQIATDNRQLSSVLSWPWCPKIPIHLSIDLLPSTAQRCPSSVVKQRLTHAFLVQSYIRFDHELVPLSFPFGDPFFPLFFKGPVSLSKRVFDCDCIVSFTCINIECVCNQVCVTDRLCPWSSWASSSTSRQFWLYGSVFNSQLCNWLYHTCCA